MLDTVFNRPIQAINGLQAVSSRLPQLAFGSVSDRFERQAKSTGQPRFGALRSQVTAFQRQMREAESDDATMSRLRREFRITIVPNAIAAYDEGVAHMEKDRARGSEATLDFDYGPFNHIEEMGVLYQLAKRLGCKRQETQIRDYYTDLLMNKMDGLYTVPARIGFLEKLAPNDPEIAQQALSQELDKSIAKSDGTVPSFAMYGIMVKSMAEIAHAGASSSDETPLETRIRELAMAQHRTLLGQPNKGADLARRINDAADFLGYVDCEALVNKYVDEMAMVYKSDARKISIDDVKPLRAVCYRYGFDAAQAKLDAMGNAGLPDKVRTADKVALIAQGAKEPVVVPNAAEGMPSMVSVVDLPTMHIKQANVGDCVLLATIDAIQRNKREGLNILANLAKLQPDGSWLVQFHGDAEPIKVQPTHTTGETYSSFFLFRWGQMIWDVLTLNSRKEAAEAPDVVRVIERAYGRRLKAEQQTEAGTMAVLDQGTRVLHDRAMHAMIGPRADYKTFSQGTDLSRTYVSQALAYIQQNPEYTIAWAGTRHAGQDNYYVGAAKKLVGSHAYAIVDVTDTQVVLANPHDNKQLLTLTHDEFADGVKDIYTARLPRREKS